MRWTILFLKKLKKKCEYSSFEIRKLKTTFVQTLWERFLAHLTKKKFEIWSGCSLGSKEHTI